MTLSARLSDVRKAIVPLGKLVARKRPVSKTAIKGIWKKLNALLGTEPPPLEPFSIQEEQS